MKIDFDSVDDLADYVTVPAGTYLCKIAEVQTGVTRDGDVRWGLRLVVAEGEFVGRQAAWDNLVFSARGMGRARMILRALRLPSQGTVDVQPEDLLERSAFVIIEPEQFRAPATGRVIRRNRVPFEGYRAVEDYVAPARAEAAATEADDDEAALGSGEDSPQGSTPDEQESVQRIARSNGVRRHGADPTDARAPFESLPF